MTQPPNATAQTLIHRTLPVADSAHVARDLHRSQTLRDADLDALAEARRYRMTLIIRTAPDPADDAEYDVDGPPPA